MGRDKQSERQRRTVYAPQTKGDAEDPAVISVELENMRTSNGPGRIHRMVRASSPATPSSRRPKDKENTPSLANSISRGSSTAFGHPMRGLQSRVALPKPARRLLTTEREAPA